MNATDIGKGETARTHNHFSVSHVFVFFTKLAALKYKWHHARATKLRVFLLINAHTNLTYCDMNFVVFLDNN